MIGREIPVWAIENRRQLRSRHRLNKIVPKPKGITIASEYHETFALIVSKYPANIRILLFRKTINRPRIRSHLFRIGIRRRDDVQLEKTQIPYFTASTLFYILKLDSCDFRGGDSG